MAIQMTREQRQVSASWFWMSIRSFRMDQLARKYTASTSLADLCELGRKNSYRPSIPCNSAKDPVERGELTELANAYDRMQEQRGDDRRAYRC